MQALHTRSTTLPSQYLGGRPGTQAFGNDSAYISSILGISNISGSNSSNNDVNSNSNLAMTSIGHHRANTNTIISTGTNSSNSTSHSNIANHSNSMNHLASGQHNQYSTSTSIPRTNTNISNSSILSRDSSILHSTANTNTSSIFGSKNTGAIGSAGAPGQKGPAPGAHALRSASSKQRAEDEEEHSPLVSPALTYSARTPATLSPATPFSGFFPHAGDAFEGPAMGGGALQEGVADRFEQHVGEKQKARAGV